MLWRSGPGALVVALVMVSGAWSLAAGGCEAELEEDCTAGPCTGATVAAGGPADCGVDTSGLPCDVFGVLSDKCHVCHQQPPQSGAPFSLLSYDDTQETYLGEPIWVRMERAIKPDAQPRMPFLQDPLPAEQAAILDAWFATCQAGACARAEETSGSTGSSSGQGGGGGAGGGPPDCEGFVNGLPCEVFATLEQNCHRCHQDPPLNDAPFPLLTYENTQAEYVAGVLIWEKMAQVIEPGNIPQMPFDLWQAGEDLPEGPANVLRAWFETCDAGECLNEE